MSKLIHVKVIFRVKAYAEKEEPLKTSDLFFDSERVLYIMSSNSRYFGPQEVSLLKLQGSNKDFCPSEDDDANNDLFQVLMPVAELHALIEGHGAPDNR